MIKPLGNRVLVQRAKADEKSAGGIIIPDNAKERPVRGEVLAVGPGSFIEKPGGVNGVGHRPLDVKPGDVVLFGKYAGTEIGDPAENQVILTEDDILAIVEP
jgi:chaperonin GroES